MRVLIAYDISCDTKRQKVADIFDSVITRVQRSVFEGDLPAEALAQRVARAVPLIDPESDSIRVYHLCAACAPRVDVYGRQVRVDPDAVQIL